MAFSFYWIQIINDAPNNANSTAATVEYIETGINVMSDLFKESHLSLVQAYDYGPNLTAIANISAPFNSTEWVREYTTIATDLGYGVSNAIFIKFGIEGPVQDPSVHLTQAQTFEVLANVFSTVFAYIYIAAGSFVLALAVLYWFGKTNKSLAEWYAIGMRVALGLGLCAFCAISFVNSPASDDFTFSAWPLPIVTLMYFIGKPTLPHPGSQEISGETLKDFSFLLVVTLRTTLTTPHLHSHLARQSDLVALK